MRLILGFAYLTGSCGLAIAMRSAQGVMDNEDEGRNREDGLLGVVVSHLAKHTPDIPTPRIKQLDHARSVSLTWTLYATTREP